jgi:hypothetical protein
MQVAMLVITCRSETTTAARIAGRPKDWNVAHLLLGLLKLLFGFRFGIFLLMNRFIFGQTFNSNGKPRSSHL